jgi:hypothetical protein
MESTGPIGPRPKVNKTAPIKLPTPPAPPESTGKPGKPIPDPAMGKDDLVLTPHRTCKCSPGELTPVPVPMKTLQGCMELPSKTIKGCMELPGKTAPGMCCFEPGPGLPIKTAKACGIIEGPFPTMKCPIDLPDLPIKTLKGCGIELPMTMKCTIGPIKTMLGCGEPAPIRTLKGCGIEGGPIKTAKICSVIPPHPPIRTCWCIDPGGPVKTIEPARTWDSCMGDPIKTRLGCDGPIKTIAPAPTPQCFIGPDHKGL